MKKISQKFSSYDDIRCCSFKFRKYMALLLILTKLNSHIIFLNHLNYESILLIDRRMYIFCKEINYSLILPFETLLDLISFIIYYKVRIQKTFCLRTVSTALVYRINLVYIDSNSRIDGDSGFQS